jgi:hypothetical protein
MPIPDEAGFLEHVRAGQLPHPLLSLAMLRASIMTGSVQAGIPGAHWSNRRCR